jgi:NurA-like 5'-3' nuclease
MGLRGKPKGQDTIKISANIPSWKGDIMKTLGIHPTFAINTGIDLVLEDMIQNGRISQDGISVYIKTLENQTAEIAGKIARAKIILKEKAITQAQGQVRVWDRDIEEERIIPASQYNPAQHVMKEAIQA